MIGLVYVVQLSFMESPDGDSIWVWKYGVHTYIVRNTKMLLCMNGSPLRIAYRLPIIGTAPLEC